MGSLKRLGFRLMRLKRGSWRDVSTASIKGYLLLATPTYLERGS